MAWASTSLDTPGSGPDPLPRTADGAHAVCVSGALSDTGHLASLVHPPDAYALILRIVRVEERRWVMELLLLFSPGRPVPFYIV